VGVGAAGTSTANGAIEDGASLATAGAAGASASTITEGRFGSNTRTWPARSLRSKGCVVPGASATGAGERAYGRRAPDDRLLRRAATLARQRVDQLAEAETGVDHLDRRIVVLGRKGGFLPHDLRRIGVVGRNRQTGGGRR
jgi:hypothetical protein